VPAQVKFGGRKTREGTVVSDKMEKTVVVAVETHFRHPLYKKIIRRVKRYLAHNENGEAALGDRVRIGESQPISRRKRWRVVEVLTHVELPEVVPGAIDLELLGEVKTEEPVEEPAAAVAEKAHDAQLPAEFRAIATSSQITRGDLAALIGVRLDDMFRTAPVREVVITDTQGHWAAAWIAPVASVSAMT
jgi:small subunit ribosomal protein S17